MGNSPSKNDPLPNTTVNRSVGSSSDVAAGDIEPEDSSSLGLPRPTGNGSKALTERLAKHSSGVVQDVGPQSPPQNIPSRPPSAGRKTSDPSLAVDINAFKALSLSGSLPHSGHVSLAWKMPYKSAAVVSAEYGSSLESQKSDGLSSSPLFTSSERDSTLLLSLCSPSSLPTIQKTEHPLTVLLRSFLAPIAETPIETAPKPKSSLLKPQVISKSALLGSVIAKQTPVSPISISPPPVPQARKTDFDIDGIIERLIDIGHKQSSFKTASSRKQKDKLPLTTAELKSILAKSRSIFLGQPTLLKLSPPVKIVGDIHGQFFDLIRIFDSCGYPPYTNYLFLGDYVDRGYKSLEVILLLLCYKIKYPENFFMLRGNHESANITKIYGFYDECKRRLPLISGSHKLWKSFVDVFNTLPIAATINDKIFCIHGGLSPELHSLKQIEQIQRPTDIPDKGLLADLLWSDPDAQVQTFSLTNWPKNDRGVSYCFGKKHVDHFLAKFNMDLIVRGHMVVEDGYEFFNKRKLVTVFLAPNYCGDFNNYGAIMGVDKSLCCSFELIKP